jgi:hypothetical protein
MENHLWNKLASNILKAEIKRKGVSYDQLYEKLTALGIVETPNSIRIKISRGAFQFAFFLQCAAALGVTSLKLDNLLEDIR